jgi:hypothetical protein
MGHYDARFFTTVVSDEERKQTQLHMIRAYLDFFREKGLDTWIAHGTLLGWWWNGQVNTHLLVLSASTLTFDIAVTMGLGYGYSSIRRNTHIHG